MRGLRRTIKHYEDLDIAVDHRNSGQLRMDCPFCYDKEVECHIRTPKPDSNKSLAINTETHKGYCHRCDTIIIPRKDAGKVDLLLFEVPEDNLSPVSLPDVNINGIPMAYENKAAMAYLKSRNTALTPSVVKKLDFRWVETGKTVPDVLEGYRRFKLMGILAPLKYAGSVKSYQIRYITDNRKFRFHTMEGKKLLYHAKPIPVYSEITVCEGVYDAIACMAMGFPNVVALLGKSPSNLQIAQFREMCPYRVNLCMDEPDINYEVLRVLKRRLKTVESHKTWRFSGAKDPEDFYRANQDFRFSKDSGKKLGIRL